MSRAVSSPRNAVLLVTALNTPPWKVSCAHSGRTAGTAVSRCAWRLIWSRLLCFEQGFWKQVAWSGGPELPLAQATAWWEERRQSFGLPAAGLVEDKPRLPIVGSGMAVKLSAVLRRLVGTKHVIRRNVMARHACQLRPNDLP